MDLDAMNTEVNKLKVFRTKVEEAVAFYEGLKAAGFKLPDPAAADATTSDAATIEGHLDALSGTVSEYGDRLTSLETKISSLAAPEAVDVSSLESRLSALEQAKDAPVALPDGLEAMLAWFEQNKDGLDVLLSLDGIPDEPEPVAEAPVAGADAPQTSTGTEAPAAAADAPGTVQG